jgi:hypothetical protein
MTRRELLQQGVLATPDDEAERGTTEYRERRSGRDSEARGGVRRPGHSPE